jgi:NAD-dependent deacetylase sirtuin 2
LITFTGSGLYDNVSKFNLPRAESIFDIEYFCSNPTPFMTVAKDLLPGRHRPTKSHFFLHLLEKKRRLRRIYTQNIDDLEKLAGVSEEVLIQAHGTFSSGRCVACSRPHSRDYFRPVIRRGDVPRCKSCAGLVKPDVVFFGEDLPERYRENQRDDFRNVDLLIVMGTSLVVKPIGDLIYKVPASCHRLLINRELVGNKFFLPVASKKTGKRPQGIRGVFLGDCDVGCAKLAQLCGWGHELKAVEQGGICDFSSEICD